MHSLYLVNETAWESKKSRFDEWIKYASVDQMHIKYAFKWEEKVLATWWGHGLFFHFLMSLTLNL